MILTYSHSTSCGISLLRWRCGKRSGETCSFPCCKSGVPTTTPFCVRSSVQVLRTRIAPLLADIIGQGVQEGVFTVAFPDQMGRVVVSLIQDLNDRLAELVLAAEPGQRMLRTAEHTVAAYTDALERMLGVPAGSVLLVKTQTLRPWFDPEPNLNGKP